MAGKKNFKINTPKNQVVQVKKNTVSLNWNNAMVSKVKGGLSDAQSFVDSECLRYDDPLMPRLSGAMIKSGIISSVLGSGEVTYNTPYSRRQYYEHKGGKGQRGPKWFERMKSSHKESILKGARQKLG